MKQIIQINNEDFIIETSFVPNRVQDETGTWQNEFADKEAGIMRGKERIDSVYFYSQDADENGYGNGKFRKIYLSADSIHSLSDKIKSIQAEIVETKTSPNYDDLPF